MKKLKKLKSAKVLSKVAQKTINGGNGALCIFPAMRCDDGRCS